ncbi:MAG: hypothetical protein KUG65_06055 [Sphingomonadaceae bacterium]|nr:hypothetical protein [Sphingomonadaceae bacterium]
MRIMKLAAAIMLFALASIAAINPVMAEPVLDPVMQADQSDGYGPWIIIDGKKPDEVGQFETIRWRNNDGIVAPSAYLTYGLRWGNKQAIRLKLGHPLYARLERAVSQPPPATQTQTDTSGAIAELKALRTDIGELIDRRIESLAKGDGSPSG